MHGLLFFFAVFYSIIIGVLTLLSKSEKVEG